MFTGAYSEGRLVDDGGIRSLLLRMGVAHEASGGDQSRCQCSVKAHIVNNRRNESGAHSTKMKKRGDGFIERALGGKVQVASSLSSPIGTRACTHGFRSCSTSTPRYLVLLTKKKKAK